MARWSMQSQHSHSPSRPPSSRHTASRTIGPCATYPRRRRSNERPQPSQTLRGLGRLIASPRASRSWRASDQRRRIDVGRGRGRGFLARDLERGLAHDRHDGVAAGKRDPQFEDRAGRYELHARVRRGDERAVIVPATKPTARRLSRSLMISLLHVLAAALASPPSPGHRRPTLPACRADNRLDGAPHASDERDPRYIPLAHIRCASLTSQPAA